jgi:hypothetical protein
MINSAADLSQCRLRCWPVTVALAPIHSLAPLDPPTPRRPASLDPTNLLLHPPHGASTGIPWRLPRPHSLLHPATPRRLRASGSIPRHLPASPSPSLAPPPHGDSRPSHDASLHPTHPLLHRDLPHGASIPLHLPRPTTTHPLLPHPGPHGASIPRRLPRPHPAYVTVFCISLASYGGPLM